MRLTCHSISQLRIGLFFAAVAGFTLVAINTQFGPLGKDTTIVPMIAAGAMLILSLCLAGCAFRPQSGMGGKVEEEPLPPLSKLELLRFVTAFVVVGLHAWLLPWLGVLIGGATLQFLLYILIGVRPLRALLISVAVVAVLYVCIGLLLGVQLPLGLLE